MLMQSAQNARAFGEEIAVFNVRRCLGSITVALISGHCVPRSRFRLRTNKNAFEILCCSSNSHTIVAFVLASTIFTVTAVGGNPAKR